MNPGSMVGSRRPSGMRSLPHPIFGSRIPGVPSRVLLRMPPPLLPLPMYGSPRQRLPPLGSVGNMPRFNGMPPMFPARSTRGLVPPIAPPMRPRSNVPCGPPMRPWGTRGMLPPQMMPYMRPKYNANNGNVKGKMLNHTKKVNKNEELELKKPWITDEIRNEIQRKNKLYAKARKSKEAAEREEFRELRNKVTKMIKDAKNDYFSKHPEQAHLYQPDEESYDQRDENCFSSDDDTSHYCEVCDREFQSENILAEHKNTHTLCGIEGCTFSAHPLLVEKHINMQHRTGLYQRMKNLSKPEDIDKWIMERKKRYPTEANITLRKAEEREKLQRGEIIKQNSNAQMRTRKSGNFREKKRKSRKRYVREINNTCTQTDEVYRGIHPFPGTMNIGIGLDEEVEQKDLYDKITGNISDEDDILQISATIESTNLSVINPCTLPTLVADYGNETDDDECPEEMPTKIIKVQALENNQIENAVNEGTLKMLSCTTNDTSNKNLRNTVAKHKDKQRHKTNHTMMGDKNGRVLDKYYNKLLGNLLSRSIQHERNLICQCVKYIIENKFFDS